ncbi:hypothetical protein KUTeg_014163 [Tegillarca granosa]|uniref:Helicase ATP-binding domain-containing protein n=1 Tax=Tegillarca granosa TaxID=220873 RepID=A0ABQ9EVT8_TEGGR|nr:hypothetical protein KUTeg_014163 [Tegillarca granosa]
MNWLLLTSIPLRQHYWHVFSITSRLEEFHGLDIDTRKRLSVEGLSLDSGTADLLNGYIPAFLKAALKFPDMIRRRNLRTRSIKMLVLDEADEMLNKGFKEQIYDVYRYLPPATQVVLVSATLPHEILEMTSKFMTDPIRILVKRIDE